MLIYKSLYLEFIICCIFTIYLVDKMAINANTKRSYDTTEFFSLITIEPMNETVKKDDPLVLMFEDCGVSYF